MNQSSPNTIAYDAWHAKVAQEKSQDDPLAFAWHRAAARHIAKDPRGHLLEIGCGRGEFARYLASVHSEMTITAVDFSSTAIEIAQQNNGAALANRPTFRAADATQLPFEDQTFDWVISCECIEHVLEPQQMADEVFRVLKPNGRFCVTTENYFNGMLIAWARAWLTGRRFDSGTGVQPHENFFLFWMVNRLLRKAGLTVDGTESCHYQWLLLPRINPARLCTEQFSSPVMRRLARPFGRHYTYFGRRVENK